MFKLVYLVDNFFRPAVICTMFVLSLLFLFDNYFIVPNLEDTIQRRDTTIEHLQDELVLLETETAALRSNLETMIQRGNLAIRQTNEVKSNLLALETANQELEEQVLSLLSKKNTRTVHVLSSPTVSTEWTSGWEVTYYTLSVESTGKSPDHPQYGFTRSGRKVEDGVTIAVDTSIIPLGTWVELKFPDGKTIKRRADDTGGAVKGKIVDIYIDATHKQALKLGRTKGVEVRILGEATTS